MYYSYIEIEYVATSFSPARTDLALKLLSEEVDEDADDFVKFELVDIAGETDFVGDEQLFFLGVTKKKQDQRKHIVNFNLM